MLKLKQGTAAIVLVVSLGMIAPGSFGGPASADRSDNPNLALDDDPFPLRCDLNGDSDGDTAYVESHYEAEYNFLSTANSRVLYDPDSDTSLTQRTRIDVLQVEYAPLPDQPDDPEYLLDTEVEWFDEWEAPYVYPHGKPKGRKTVRCVNISDAYKWTISEEEAEMEPRLVEGATYLETDWQLYDVMLTASGKRTAQANDMPKAKKQGKHRGKGKRGR
jgi:hypothetical protein